MSLLTFFWVLFWIMLAGLAVAAGFSVHTRRREALASRSPVLDDEAVRRILETGELSVDEDEPLDLTEIEQEEERFWSESWDEPEEW